MSQKYTILKEEKVRYDGNIISIKPQKTVAIALASNQSEKAVCTVKIGDDVKIGSLIGYIDDNVYLPIYSSVSGKVIAFEEYQYCTLNKVQHVIIENNFLDEKVPLFPKDVDYQNLSRQQLIEFTKKSGLVGMSGAGFATYGKYLSACDTLIINGCECESYLISDYVNVINNCRDMLDGILIMEKMAQTCNSYIVLKKSATEEIEKVSQMIESDKKYQHLHLYLIDDFYPCGWEKLLTEKITGRTYNMYTTECQVIVNNISTAISLKQIFSQNMPVIEKLITVAGNGIDNSAVIKARIGYRVKEILDEVGSRVPGSIIYCGGTMMGSVMEDDNFYICSPYNGLIVMQPPHYIERVCDAQCHECEDHCCCELKVKDLLQACLHNDMSEAKKLRIVDCCECNICSYVCTNHIDVRQYIRDMKYKIIGEDNNEESI
ncbi:MAG: hypothetical protein Q4C64_00635 [Erysipelotrichia bacterium]|nr:hypothetical protein [Erysipelotrichia bacterium]